MAFEVAKGTLAAPAPTGNQTYATPFVPKAIIFWYSDQTAEGISANQRMGIGFATGSANRVAACVMVQDNVATTDCESRLETTRCINQENNALVVVFAADFVSFNSGPSGFTLNWVTTSSGKLVHYLALGGSDLTNAIASTFTANTIPGDQDITTAGFQPDCLLLLGTGSSVNVAKLGIGAAQSSTKRWCMAINARDGQGIPGDMAVRTTQRTDSVYINIDNGGAQESLADFVAMLSNGFRINWSDAPLATTIIGYLALKGGQYDVGAVNACTTTDCTTDQTVGFPPTGLLLASWGQVASTTIASDSEFSIGGTDGTNQGHIGGTCEDNVLNSQADSRTVTTKAIGTLLEGNPTTVDGEADANLTVVSNGFRLTWTDAPAVSIQVCYLAIGQIPITKPMFRGS